LTTLKENLSNRVKKLTKPGNSGQAVQPFLEAVSNACMAIDDRMEATSAAFEGYVRIDVEGLGGDDVQITVRDNGIGLDHDRYEAFCTVDTDYKSERGGKGVGRLYWLDAFKKTVVESQYRDGDLLKVRAFEFRLADTDQVSDIDPSSTWMSDEIGTEVRFTGLRQGPYLEKFPKQADALKNYLAAQFIADFLGGGGPTIRLSITTKSGTESEFIYPETINELVERGPVSLTAIEVQDVGRFEVQGYLCDGKASRGLNGKHQVHFLGNDRTVESRKVDDLLGINNLTYGDADQLAMHLVVSGEFLDDRVAESRTAFTFPDSVLQSIVKAAVSRARRSWSRSRSRNSTRSGVHHSISFSPTNPYSP